MTPAQIFHEHTLQGPDADGHLIWRGPLRSLVPVIWGEAGPVNANRIAVELATGQPVPRGVHVIRTCADWRCVAAAHYRVGAAKRPVPVKRLPLRERFFEKTRRDETTGCLHWTASTVHGYGLIGVGRTNKRAHRVAWELAHGQIPDGQVVMHTCHNPGCVDVAHLKVGTQAENLRERDANGRQFKGRRDPLMRPLTRQDREVILYMNDTAGMTQTVIADIWGVPHTTITRALKLARADRDALQAASNV